MLTWGDPSASASIHCLGRTHCPNQPKPTLWQGHLSRQGSEASLRRGGEGSDIASYASDVGSVGSYVSDEVDDAALNPDAALNKKHVQAQAHRPRRRIGHASVPTVGSDAHLQAPSGKHLTWQAPDMAST